MVIDTVVGAGRGSPPDTAGAPRAKAPPEQSADSPSLSPLVLAYLVGPFALGLLLVFRGFGLVARLPVWAYFAAIVGACILSVLVEPWHDAPEGSFKLHARLAVHVTSVSMVIYMTGWGPALGMAYAFVALQELQTWGAALWRPVMCWSLLNIAVAQYLLWLGWVPSFLTRSQAETVGALGAFVLVIVIRMAGATGEKKERAEALLAHQALHDMLTGLPNRSFFYDRTEDALERTAVGGSSCAVMLFDLDRFKEINDTMGHRYGDRVLTEVGPRVQAVLRGADVLARLGGDEFCVLLSQVASEADAVRVAQRIVAMLEMPFDVDGTILGIEASCGIAMAPPDGGSADLLLQQADVAMYVAKEAQGSVVVYTDELNVNTPERLALLGDLRNAVLRTEFVLHYQPKASMRTGEVLGAEALIRWEHPMLGLLGPDTFIPEAERTGLIEPMTHWVLDDALSECRHWLDNRDPDDRAELSVAVNLSARSLLDASLVDVVRGALDRWGVPAHLLDLEITETILMTDPPRARRVLTELAEMGVTLSIDDFGTGYSSLAYLRDLPVHELKIDRAFVQDMGTDSDEAVIVRAVVDLAGNLGLQTVAEGVEDRATWEQLSELGCDAAQGYHLARPMPAERFRSWLREYRAAPDRALILPGAVHPARDGRTPVLD
ncbi:MAG: putative bifunctional diguanylate cyclase/phosphodiesterase [Acidimicrobiales bacterium]